MLIHVFDIETTGFNESTDDILEFGYIRCNEEYEIIGHDTLYFYKDHFKIENPDAQRVHKLTRDFLRQYADDFDTNLVKMYTIMRGGILVTKNGDSFDIPFVKWFIQKYARSLYMTTEERISFDIQTYLMQDVRDYYANVLHNPSSRKRGTFDDYFMMLGINEDEIKQKYLKLFPEDAGRSDRHGALYDAFMTYEVFRRKGEIHGKF